mmetsp:Transcript_26027/g.49359  ORF Transcript_26027/g.49359 Transcript_26027/m.49359 type:complete len:230 (-) Transcript_26027:76-765(-)
MAMRRTQECARQHAVAEFLALQGKRIRHEVTRVQDRVRHARVMEFNSNIGVCRHNGRDFNGGYYHVDQFFVTLAMFPNKRHYLKRIVQIVGVVEGQLDNMLHTRFLAGLEECRKMSAPSFLVWNGAENRFDTTQGGHVRVLSVPVKLRDFRAELVKIIQRSGLVSAETNVLITRFEDSLCHTVTDDTGCAGDEDLAGIRIKVLKSESFSDLHELASTNVKYFIQRLHCS